MTDKEIEMALIAHFAAQTNDGCSELEACAHQSLTLARADLQPECSRGSHKRVFGHLPEVLIPSTSRAQPRVLELSSSPERGEPRAFAREHGLGAPEDGARVEDGEGVEQDRPWQSGRGGRGCHDAVGQTGRRAAGSEREKAPASRRHSMCLLRSNG